MVANLEEDLTKYNQLALIIPALISDIQQIQALDKAFASNEALEKASKLLQGLHEDKDSPDIQKYLQNLHQSLQQLTVFFNEQLTQPVMDFEKPDEMIAISENIINKQEAIIKIVHG